jgi:hypothetical protein
VTKETTMPRGKPADLKVLAAAGALGGIAAIAAERQRHATEYPLNYGRIKGYSAEHDDGHEQGELADAGAFYAQTPKTRSNTKYRSSRGDGMLHSPLWPFDGGWYDPSKAKHDAYCTTGYLDIDERKRELEKAGALIAAEWDRIDRIERRQAQQNGTTPPAAPALEIKPEPVTSVTLRIDLERDLDEHIVWAVRRMLLGYLTRLEDLRAGSHDAETFDAKTLGLTNPWPATKLTVTCNTEPDQFARQLADLSRLRPFDQWNDDDGVVLWWALQDGEVVEPPAHVGTPNDSDWPTDYEAPQFTWYWSPLPSPSPIV